MEIGTALMVLALAIALGLAAPMLFRWFMGQMQQGLSCRPFDDTAAGFAAVLRSRALACLAVTAPFLLAAAGVSVLGSLVAAGGWNFAPKAIRLRFDRLSPTRGLRELFSMRSGVQVLTGLAKLIVLSVLSYVYLRGRLGECLALTACAPHQILLGICRLALGLIARVAAALMAIALLELLYQRFNYKRRLRMTRQEVKEERKEYEVSPEVKGRIRAIQIAMVRRRMIREVPKADVVLTNPTHVAVALRYEAGSMDAPAVVAKGAELMAEKIKEVARAHGVPVLERPELARTLYQTVDVGQVIPESLFVAVAEVLAMIYRLRTNRALAGK